jgi:hypothetical protein
MNAGTGAPPMDNPGMPPMPYMAQVPYGSAPMQNAGVPAYAPMPYAQPYPTQQMASPYPQQTNVWPAHNTHPAPFAPIPSFAPPGYGPAMPPYPQFSPMQPPMPPMPPTAPMPNMTPMELPHMAMPKAPNGYPTHPFTRSPRDFFMWSENMEDEARMRNRPFPVPR